MALTWLHISDLHLTPEGTNENYATDRQRILDNLCKAVSDNRKNKTWVPDLIFITGDIANHANKAVFKGSGGASPLATVFFDKLLDAAKLKRERLFVVPGNHEIDRNALPKSCFRTPIDFAEEHRDKLLEEYFKEAGTKPHIADKFKTFIAWYNDYFQGVRSFPLSTTCELHTPEINGYSLALLLMNSAIFCTSSKTDKGNLWVGRGYVDTCMEKLCSETQHPPELTIALMHHPLPWLHQSEDATISADLKRVVIGQRRNVFVCGHQHTTAIDDHDPFHLAAGALWQDAPLRRRALYARFDNGLLTVYPICNSESPEWKWSSDISVFSGEPTHQKTFNLNRANPSGVGDLSVPTDYQDEWECYVQQLKKELGYTRLLGAPRREQRQALNLDETFIPLRIQWQRDPLSARAGRSQSHDANALSPDELMRRAFRNTTDTDRILLVFGDAGIGKTTLMQYYALSNLNEVRWRAFGFEQQPRVFFLRLRELHKNSSKQIGMQVQEQNSVQVLPDSLATALHDWSCRFSPSVRKVVFESWLQSNRPSLVLCDGLDEVINKADRKAVCAWIDQQRNSYSDVHIVVTTRRSGYAHTGKDTADESVEFFSPLYHADLADLDEKQQRQFLFNWHRAVSRVNQFHDSSVDEGGQERIDQDAERFAGQIMTFLADDRYREVRKLAAIPMVLQMLAYLLKEAGEAPEIYSIPATREELYSELFDYLVLKRDDTRGIIARDHPIRKMTADRFRNILGPLALAMLEQHDGEKQILTQGNFPLQVSETALKQILEKKLNELRRSDFEPPAFDVVRVHLVERAELLQCIEHYLSKTYEFRHKSFAEYLVGCELRKSTDGFRTIIGRFHDPSWEEIIRFFLIGADEVIFDSFMECLLDPAVKETFTQQERNLFLDLVRKAPNKKSPALCRRFRELTPDLPDRQERQLMMIDALGAIGDPPALACLEEFRLQRKSDSEPQKPDQVASRVGTVLSELDVPLNQWTPQVVTEGGATILRLPFELNAEYILIRGTGSFRYSKSKKAVKVDDRYFARFSVTNRRYRRFIDYLSGKDKEFAERLKVELFESRLEAIAESKAWNGKYRFADYLKAEAEPAKRFRSEFDDDRKFGGDDQPVVGVSWYGARAYCLWLSLVESGGTDIRRYRLPEEAEWEWAAGGGKRTYPWGGEEPDETRANYGSHVGATTPVGSYPAGATPEGLYDMEGNVWEWQENWYDKDKDVRAVRGGSWVDFAGLLRCVARSGNDPGGWGRVYGFRVVRPRPF